MKPALARVLDEDGYIITEGIQQPVGHPHIPYREAQGIANRRGRPVLLEIGYYYPSGSLEWTVESEEWVHPEYQ